MAAAVMLFAAALCGQSGVRPVFEVASVKSSADKVMFVRVLPGGRLSAAAPVKMLVVNAFGVQGFQIVGGPAWMDSDRYAIDAKAPANASRAEVMAMLQSLLEDRFQMRTHRETRQLPVYELVAGKNGLKLPVPKEGSCAVAGSGGVPAPGPAPAGGRMAPGPGGPATMTPPCGAIMLAMSPDGAVMQGGKVPMSELVRTLAMVTGRPVIDKTRYTGVFDVRLPFTPDLASDGMPRQPVDPSAPAPDSAAPSILGVLQEQLGLKLDSARGPVEVVVIDHLEKPTEN